MIMYVRERKTINNFDYIHCQDNHVLQLVLSVKRHKRFYRHAFRPSNISVRSMKLLVIASFERENGGCVT